MRRWGMLVLLLAPLVAAAGEVYRWVDDQGRVHYGDRPPPEWRAEPAALPDIQIVDSPEYRTPAGRSAPGKRALSAEAVAACLVEKGAVLYGASWCGQCVKQRRMFGDASLPYVECSADGSRRKTAGCAAEDIPGYPTWVFPSGQRVSGVVAVSRLASLAGCR
jgi:hypothetical protein